MRRRLTAEEQFLRPEKNARSLREGLNVRRAGKSEDSAERHGAPALSSIDGLN